MRRVRYLIWLLAVGLFASASVPGREAHPNKITVKGKLTRVVAMGGETTSWALQLKREIMLEGKKMKSVEISGPVERFEKLNDQRVRATGTLTHRQGVERGEYLVLEVSSIQPIGAPNSAP